MTASLRNPVFCAIDTDDLGTATTLAARLAEAVGGVKLGLQFFNAHGPKGLAEVAAASDLPLFLDLKFHDIPNTVAGAVRSVVPLKPFMITVHAVGGKAMMQAAVKAATDTAYEVVGSHPLVVGVTVLTSFDDGDLAETGVSGAVLDQVRRLAALAQSSGLDGVVCSPHEAAVLRADLGPDFLLITPGVRPLWAAANDQKRIMTPVEAMAAGASYLVVGRPITGASDPAEAAGRIASDLGPTD
ncbi:MAG: orotidine-5'-phosphate decarboxylase [Rhodospirillaceae bacterium]|nr:MAG: orotidine-5'-phosphate decarboxylase [Rhodospirillaceae bacterium]